MPILLSTAEMSELAQKLAKMRYWRAKWYAWGMDKKAHYDMYRVAVGTGEWHTRLTLPTKGIVSYSWSNTKWSANPTRADW